MKKTVLLWLLAAILIPCALQSQEKAPVIGLSATYETGQNNVPNTYIISVRKAGGIPVILPVTDDPAIIARMVESIDGLILTGGEDVDPLLWYGEEPLPAMGGIVPVRDFFDIHLARKAVEAGIPVLGICRGEQVLNVAFGGRYTRTFLPRSKAKHPLNTARMRPVNTEHTP